MFIPFTDFPACFRLNGPIQAYSNVEMGSPPTHDLQAGYMRSMSKPFHLMPRILQNSPSRFGLQPVQRFSHGRPTRVGEWNQSKVQPPPSSFSSGDPRSPRSNSFANTMTWGILSIPSILYISLILWTFIFYFGMH